MLKNHLRLLMRAGLIHTTGSVPASDYLFHHVLVQDVAYRSLLREDRLRLHQAVGESLKQLYEGREQEFAPLLAHHFYEAQDKEQAFRYYAMAAAQAARSYAIEEALLYYERALELLPTEGVAPEVRVDLSLGWGRMLEVCGRYEEALAGYHALLSWATTRGENATELAALLASATLLSTPNPVYNPPEAESTLQRALDLAKSLGKREAEAHILWNLLVLVQYSAGDPERAIAYGEQAMEIAQALQLRGRLAYILNDLAKPYWLAGRLEEAHRVQQEARQLWEEFGNIPMQVDNLEAMSRLCLARGEYEEMIRLTDRSFALSEAIDHRWGKAQSRFFVGHAYIDTGRVGEAIQLMEETAPLAEAAGHSSVRLAVMADLAWLYGTLGAVEEGLALAQEALRLVHPRLRYLRAWPLAYLARLHLLQGNLAEAERLAAEARENFTKNMVLVLIPVGTLLASGEVALAAHRYDEALSTSEELLAYLHKTQTKPFIPDALLMKAQALVALGNDADATATLEEALALAERLGIRRILWRLQGFLAEIEARRGNEARARALRQAAQTHIAYIAEHIPRPALRDTFLASPPVRSILDGA